MRVVRSATALTFVLLSCPNAEAHHGHSVSRLDAGGPGRVRLTQIQPPRADLALDYRLTYFSQEDLGSALLQQLLPSLTVVTQYQTYATVLVPIGFVQTNPRGSLLGRSEAQQQAGIGDIALVGGQELLSLLGLSPSADNTLTVQAGFTVPSGPYDGPQIKHTTFAEGGTTITTFDTRTSIGSGSWTAQAALRGSSRLTQNIMVDGRIFSAIPLTETPDNARWGPDFGVDLGTTWILAPDRFALTAGPTFRWHGADRYESDLGAPSTAGRRKQLGANLGVQIGVTKLIRCSLGAHVPFWQDFEGLQLSETVSASGGCSLGLGL